MADTESQLKLVQRLMPLLLEGEHPCLATLRQQWQSTKVTIRSETNWGFYADFEVPPAIERVEPRDFAGGNASIKVEGLQNDAGCILYIRGGSLALLEVYTYDEPWEPPPRFGAIVNHMPVTPGSDAQKEVPGSEGAR